MKRRQTFALEFTHRLSIIPGTQATPSGEIDVVVDKAGRSISHQAMDTARVTATRREQSAIVRIAAGAIGTAVVVLRIGGQQRVELSHAD